MDELIRKVSERAGISGEQAKSAVTAVIDFVKDKVPAIGQHLQGLLGGGTTGGGEGGGGNPFGGLADKLGGMFGS